MLGRGISGDLSALLFESGEGSGLEIGPDEFGDALDRDVYELHRGENVDEQYGRWVTYFANQAFRKLERARDGDQWIDD